jgi:hypothetical protein
VDCEGETIAGDKVQYAVLFDPMVHRLFVRPEVERIFDFRARKMRELFPKAASNLLA